MNILVGNKFITSCIVLCLSLGMYSYTIEVYSGLTFFHTLSLLFIFIISIFLVVVTARFHISLYSLYIWLSFFCVNLISSINNMAFLYFPSFLYELYRLILPVVIRNLVNILNVRFVFIMNMVVYIFLFLNLLILIGQNLFGVSYFSFIGLNVLDQRQILYNRPNGITENANIIGAFAFFSFVYASYQSKNRALKVLSFIVVLLSTSKASMLILIFYIATKNAKLSSKFLGFLIGLTVLVPVFIFNIYNIKYKFLNYYMALQGLDDNVEGRMLYWFYAIEHFFTKPFGSGLGTWGDYSSSFNPFVVDKNMYTSVSDSAIAHLIVEQGILFPLYIYAIYTIIPVVGEKKDRSFFICCCLFMLTNFGFSQQLFLIGFFMAIAAMYICSKDRFFEK